MLGVNVRFGKVDRRSVHTVGNELCEKRSKKPENKDNPTAGLMDMMKDMSACNAVGVLKDFVKI